ncbi:MAG: hypothetical protein E7163_00985 [Firmicutes bacterium]|nr:hypothetical protein [Bacillota bacterium]
MKSFIIKELDEDLKIEDFELKSSGFKYKIKNNNDLGVKEITIVSPDIVSDLVSHNFDKKYKKILEFYFNSLQDEDTTEGNLLLALDEITRLRNTLIKKYNIYVKRKVLEKLLKKLKILENEIRSKIIDFKLIKETLLGYNNNIEEKSKGR